MDNNKVGNHEVTITCCCVCWLKNQNKDDKTKNPEVLTQKNLDLFISACIGIFAYECNRCQSNGCNWVNQNVEKVQQEECQLKLLTMLMRMWRTEIGSLLILNINHHLRLLLDQHKMLCIDDEWNILKKDVYILII